MTAITIPFPSNIVNIARDQVDNGEGATTRIFKLDPSKFTSIHVKKNGETATVSVSNTIRNPSDDQGTKLTDDTDADIFYFDVSTGTGDYLAGDSKGLSFVKIVTNPSADVLYSIIQYSK